MDKFDLSALIDSLKAEPVQQGADPCYEFRQKEYTADDYKAFGEQRAFKIFRCKHKQQTSLKGREVIQSLPISWDATHPLATDECLLTKYRADIESEIESAFFCLHCTQWCSATTKVAEQGQICRGCYRRVTM